MAKSGRSAQQIRVRGIVQGVGFRPFVWQLAQRLGLCGSVYNDSEGVLIQVWGLSLQIDKFLEALQREAPPLAQIQGIERTTLSGKPAPRGFQILASPQNSSQNSSHAITAISPDILVCLDCANEVLDQNARRYRYPFANCTHCGPRFSIIRELPYDRVRTEMAAFDMCPDCRAEYQNPNDRRYHAQAIACPACGPQCWLSNAAGQKLSSHSESIAAAAALLKQGQIVAIKGLGGFQLACDASDEAAVARLRLRKHRPHKPFAVMLPNLFKISSTEDLKGFLRESLQEASQESLQKQSGPIVLVPRTECPPLADAIAPGLNEIGVMLPTTPLHLILLHDFGRPLVMTSGNLSSEPQCIDNREALDKLRGIADYWLLHDRNILCRLDDSVLRQSSGQLLRHGRGYAPQTVPLPSCFQEPPKLLALGSQEKASFALLTDRQLILSQYFGNIEELANWQDFQKSLQHYSRLYQFEPELLACDTHPEYISAKYARQQAKTHGHILLEVQHHHAHIAACMLEHQLSQQSVIGVVWDGLGYGQDAWVEDTWTEHCHLWGAEFFVADYSRAQRIASLQAIPLLGGHLAAREPWRCLLAWLLQLCPETKLEQFLTQHQIWDFFPSNLAQQLPLLLSVQSSQSSLSSSGGRLFDAVAALLLKRRVSSYDGQAAIELEALARSCAESELSPYPFEWKALKRGKSQFLELDLRSLWLELLRESQSHRNAHCALRFHVSLAQAICAGVCRIAQARPDRPAVILSGGVFQNSLLLQLCRTQLEEHQDIIGKILAPERFPANDGALALGQAVVAAARHQSL